MLNLSTKYIKNIFLFFILLFFNTFIYAENNQNFNIKIYFEPKDSNKKLEYIIQLPSQSELKYYNGSDLPNWKSNPNSIKIIQKFFHVGELINLNIHNKNPDNFFDLKILDADKSQVIWQGKINFKNNKFTLTPQINNTKYYYAHINTQREINTVWFEMGDN